MNLADYNNWSNNFRLTVEQFNTLIQTDLDKADQIINQKPRGSVERHLTANDIDISKIAHKIWDMALIYQQMMETIGIENVVFDADDLS